MKTRSLEHRHGLTDCPTGKHGRRAEQKWAIFLRYRIVLNEGFGSSDPKRHGAICLAPPANITVEVK